MNPKIILCLALVLSGGLFVCCDIARCADETVTDQIQAQNERGIIMKITVQKPWKSQTNALYSPAGAVELLNMKETICKFQTVSNQTFEIPVAALVSEKTRNVWAGCRADFYVETDSGIVGVTLSDAILRWDKGLITKINSGEKLDEVVDRFETQIDHMQLMEPSEQMTEIRYVLNPWFFDGVPGSSVPGGRATIKKYNIYSGKLQLDLESPTGIYKASVWIDIKTRKIVKAIEDGKRVFPKIQQKIMKPKIILASMIPAMSFYGSLPK